LQIIYIIKRLHTRRRKLTQVGSAGLVHWFSSLHCGSSAATRTHTLWHLYRTSIYRTSIPLQNAKRRVRKPGSAQSAHQRHPGGARATSIRINTHKTHIEKDNIAGAATGTINKIHAGQHETTHAHTRSAAHAPASLTSNLEAEVQVAREAHAERAALIWCARRLLRADGQEFAADAGHATNPAQTDTQTCDTLAQANPVRRQTPRRQTRGRAEQRHADRYADRYADTQTRAARGGSSSGVRPRAAPLVHG